MFRHQVAEPHVNRTIKRIWTEKRQTNFYDRWNFIYMLLRLNIFSKCWQRQQYKLFVRARAQLDRFLTDKPTIVHNVLVSYNISKSKEEIIIEKKPISIEPFIFLWVRRVLNFWTR